LTPLAPEDPGVCAPSRLIAQKHHFRFNDAAPPRCARFDDPAVQQAYQRLCGEPLDSIYAERIAVGTDTLDLRAHF
jgi:hypothetical protein